MKVSPLKIRFEEWFYPVKQNCWWEADDKTGQQVILKFIFQIFSCIYHSVDLILEFASRKLAVQMIVI